MGVSNAEIVALYHGRFVQSFHDLGLTFDLFTHTDTQNHWDVTHELFLNHLENGYLYRDKQQQPYCLVDQRFLADRYIEGTCPVCGYADARGDQCDNCGNIFDAAELIDPRCKICGQSEIEVRETEHFFIDLGKASPHLADVVERRQQESLATRRLQLCQTAGRKRRTCVAAPSPATSTGASASRVEGFEDKVIYVWYDAVQGYLSATREVCALEGEPEAWKDWWFDPDVKSLYFIGKDNIPFHSIIWPAMLIADGRGPESALRCARQRIPEYRGQKDQHQPPLDASICPISSLATTPTRCATPSPSTRPRPAMSTSPGTNFCGATTTSWWPPGATWSTAC